MQDKLEKLFIHPSRYTAVKMKNKLGSAQKGYEIIKTKHDLITMKTNSLNLQRRSTKVDIADKLHKARLTLAKLKFLGVNLASLILQNLNPAQVCVKVSSTYLAGVKSIKFEYVFYEWEQCFPYVGLSRGGQEVANIRQKFQELLQELVGLANLNYSYDLLSKHLQIIRKRMNALDVVIIPRISATLNYINSELEEMDREEFYRLKRAKNRNHQLKILSFSNQNLSQQSTDEIKKSSIFYNESDEDILF